MINKSIGIPNFIIDMPMVRSGDNAFRILLSLNAGEKRFSELVKEVKRASLARELRGLEKLDFLKRTVLDGRPPTTVYSITVRGRAFLKHKANERFIRVETDVIRLKSVVPDRVKELKEKL
jgi:DNA-binding HxlR family transcriptional regulator